MKYGFLIPPLLFVFCFGICVFFLSQIKPETVEEERIMYPHGLRLESVKIDGCEYWYGRNGGIDSAVLTHKGNCNNPIHIYNGENND
jgi:hypothetical protein